MSNPQNIAPQGPDLASYAAFIDKLRLNPDSDDNSDQVVERKKHSFPRTPPPQTTAAERSSRSADTDVVGEDQNKEAEALLRGEGKYAATPMRHFPSQTQPGDTATSASKKAGTHGVSLYDSGNDADDEALNRKRTGRLSASTTSSSSGGVPVSATHGKAEENVGQDAGIEGPVQGEKS